MRAPESGDLTLLHAEAGRALAAIAACRVILSLDPAHTDTQRSLSVLCSAHEASTSGQRAVSPCHNVVTTLVLALTSRS